MFYTVSIWFRLETRRIILFCLCISDNADKLILNLSLQILQVLFPQMVSCRNKVPQSGYLEKGFVSAISEYAFSKHMHLWQSSIRKKGLICNCLYDRYYLCVLSFPS